ncbi:MAG: hypothetical protein LBU27_00630 [Candidatus Peribacteria bacterium]|jgi:hypothetical protein|nr:hypothetical protein [Candidatus Peribacteria bacterium]
MSLNTQISHRQQGVEKGVIKDLPEAFPHTRTNALKSHLYERLLRALSPIDYYFRVHKEQTNKTLYQTFLDYLVVDPQNLPPKFIEHFQLNPQDADIDQQVKKLFTNPKWLDKTSSRVLFIEGKILIFRDVITSAHPHPKTKLTPGEKRQSEKNTMFNTFDSLYDAIRSQYHTLQTEAENQTDYAEYQREILLLITDLECFSRVELKDNGTFLRKLQELRAVTQSAQNFDIHNVHQHLEEVMNVMHHSTLQKNILRGANNDLRRRLENVRGIIGNVEKHRTMLETLRKNHEQILDYFFDQQFNLPLAYENYQRSYQSLQKQYGEILPFSDYHNIIERLVHIHKDGAEEVKAVLAGLQEIFTTEKTQHQAFLEQQHSNNK